MGEEATALALPAQARNVSMSFDTTEGRSELRRFAEAIALRADMIPKRFRGESKIGNVMLALDMASRMQLNPMTVMKNLYDVNGESAWKAEFLIARVNQCGLFSSINYQWDGKENTDAWRCRAYATDKATGEIRYGSWISLKMAKDEGWFGKSGSKWKTMPEQMMMYRAGAFWQRTHAPELSLGLPTVEEIEDITPPEKRPLSQVFLGTPVAQATVIADDTTGDSPSVDQIREQVLDELLDRATGQGVSNKQMEEAVGRSKAEWTDDDLGMLNGMIQKLENGEGKSEDLFGK
jgi:hypothetical protein